jgi:hypothetical protein
MITISEVIEEFARKCEEGGRAYAFRALAAKYEGCIVAEGKPVLFAVSWQSQDQSSLYRAKQLETCKPALQVEAEPVAHRHEWFRTGAMEPGQMRCIECGEWRCEAAPPARRPLTDEEIDRVIDVNWSINNYKPTYVAHRAFARAIERAHGITGGNDD